MAIHGTCIMTYKYVLLLEAKPVSVQCLQSIIVQLSVVRACSLLPFLLLTTP
jgi:hypothetical protein